MLVIALVLEGLQPPGRGPYVAPAGAPPAPRSAVLLRESPDPTVTTIYFEDTIDVLGAALALTALVLHRLFGWMARCRRVADHRLSARVRRLAHGEPQPRLLSNQAVARSARRPPARTPGCKRAGIAEGRAWMESVYLGPTEVLVAAEVRMDPRPQRRRS